MPGRSGVASRRRTIAGRLPRPGLLAAAALLVIALTALASSRDRQASARALAGSRTIARTAESAQTAASDRELAVERFLRSGDPAAIAAADLARARLGMLVDSLAALTGADPGARARIDAIGRAVPRWDDWIAHRIGRPAVGSERPGATAGGLAGSTAPPFDAVRSAFDGVVADEDSRFRGRVLRDARTDRASLAILLGGALAAGAALLALLGPFFRPGTEGPASLREAEETEVRPTPSAPGSAGTELSNALSAAERAETERARLEDALRHAQRLEAVGRLAGGIAHDFNNLLTVIKSYSTLVLNALPASSPEREDVEEIERAAVRAEALTRQLLTFSRKQVVEPRIIDLNAIVTGVDKMLRRVIGEGVEVALTLSPELEPVLADPGQLEQVIVNLAVNARDAMPRGGRLVIETSMIDLPGDRAWRAIEVPPGRYVLLRVSDTGIGMTPETLAHLFEPFYTTKPPGEGTGLGLAVVYGVVKQAGGDVFVSSEPGAGTAFEVYLPAVAEHAAEPPPDPPTDPLANGSARAGRGSESILLLEDDSAIRSLARGILEGQGYQVFPAADGDEALALGEHAPIDLIVADVTVPGVSGRTLVDRLRGRRPGLKSLFISGYAADEVIRRGIVNCATPYLQKPFTPDALARKVRETLDAGAPALPPPVPPSAQSV